MNKLKELRQEKKLTQQELADIVGVSKLTILRWEKGDRQIKPDKAQQLADYFGVSVGYLLGYEAIPEYNQFIDKIANLSGLDEYQKLKFNLKIELATLDFILDDENNNFMVTVADLKKFLDDELEKERLDNNAFIKLSDIVGTLLSISENLKKLQYNLKRLSQ